MLIFDVKVVPSSGKNKWILDKSGILKCFLKNPPLQGKANNELIKTVAQAVDIPSMFVSIITGQESRKKKIKIEANITYQMLLHKLGIEQQTTLFT